MIRAPLSPLGEGDHTVSGPLAHYLSRVLRLRKGESFIAFEPSKGREADAVVLEASGDGVRLRVGPARPARAVPTTELTFVQGLPKADKCDAIVRDAIELGATRFVVATTRRTVIRLDAARAAAKASRWTRIAEEAARQCGRGDAPTIAAPVSWEDALASVPAKAARYCLYEHATEPLAPRLLVALSERAPIAFAAGPEGGLDESEVKYARDAGYEIVSIGALTLRTETVAAAVLGAVRVWSGLWSIAWAKP